MKKILIVFCLLAANKPVDLSQNLSEYVRAFNPKQNIQKLPPTKQIVHDFIGGIKGSQNLSK